MEKIIEIYCPFCGKKIKVRAIWNELYEEWNIEAECDCGRWFIITLLGGELNENCEGNH
jgi:hypothetical protein